MVCANIQQTIFMLPEKQKSRNSKFLLFSQITLIRR